MNRQLRLRDGKIKTAYWSLVGVVAALLVSTQAVFAADMWDRFSMIMKDIYGELVAISTIVAVTVAAIALLVRMISRNQRAVDEATSWLKRIVITWIVLNSLGFIVAYLQPLTQGRRFHSLRYVWRKGNNHRTDQRPWLCQIRRYSLRLLPSGRDDLPV